MDLGLKDKIALVTGGSRGLGKAICLNLAADGVKVAVNYNSNADKAEAVVKAIKAEHGVDAMTVQGDVAVEADVKRMYDAIEDRLGAPDLLINNAGICPPVFIKDMSEETWTRTIRTNLTGTFLTCREAVNRWIEKGIKGRMVNVVSQAAFNGSATGKSHYAASKAGVVAFTVSLAYEAAPHGIAVNCIAPGMMLTEMTQETLAVNADKYKEKIPLGRVADLKEVADVINFLASGKAGYMTGATVDVSGGMLMR